ncbi:hypothetical protein N183_18385 [Sinorhizobium sp. Sb3]|nr:hypothetical protein N183_18385 [Sinorhizobium sp. Sb3]
MPKMQRALRTGEPMRYSAARLIGRAKVAVALLIFCILKSATI